MGWKGNNVETIKSSEKNDKKSTYLNIWDLSKAKLRGKCVVLNTFTKKWHLRINKLKNSYLKGMKGMD